MRTLHKLGLTGLVAGFIGIFCYGAHQIHKVKSELDKVREERPRMERRFNQRQSKTNQRIDQLQDLLRRQLLSQIKSVRRQYDKDRNGRIDNAEYDKYLRDTAHVRDILRQYDDWDGLLDKSELHKFVKYYIDKNSKGYGNPLLIQSVLKHVLKRYDDGNGVLDRVELGKLVDDFEEIMD